MSKDQRLLMDLAYLLPTDRTRYYYYYCASATDRPNGSFVLNAMFHSRVRKDSEPLYVKFAAAVLRLLKHCRQFFDH